MYLRVREEEKEVKRERKKERKTKDSPSSSSLSASSSSSSSSSIPAGARALVNDCTVYIEGMPFDSDEDALREFFKDVKTGTITRYIDFMTPHFVGNHVFLF